MGLSHLRITIAAGAFGNIIDLRVLPVRFSHPVSSVAAVVPWGEGYGSLFRGTCGRHVLFSALLIQLT